MAEIRFETGEEQFDLNGKCRVCFDPADPAFAERVCDVFAGLEELEKDGASGREREMRELIDGLFGTDVCGPLFGDMSVCAPTDGLPVWSGLLLAVMDVIREAVTDRAADNPRVAAYTSRYAG